MFLKSNWKQRRTDTSPRHVPSHKPETRRTWRWGSSPRRAAGRGQPEAQGSDVLLVLQGLCRGPGKVARRSLGKHGPTVPKARAGPLFLLGPSLPVCPVCLPHPGCVPSVLTVAGEGDGFTRAWTVPLHHHQENTLTGRHLGFPWCELDVVTSVPHRAIPSRVQPPSWQMQGSLPSTADPTSKPPPPSQPGLLEHSTTTAGLECGLSRWGGSKGPHFTDSISCHCASLPGRTRTSGNKAAFLRGTRRECCRPSGLHGHLSTRSAPAVLSPRADVHTYLCSAHNTPHPYTQGPWCTNAKGSVFPVPSSCFLSTPRTSFPLPVSSCFSSAVQATSLAVTMKPQVLTFCVMSFVACPQKL